MSDGALQVAVAALQQIAQHGSQERDRVTARAALDCIDALASDRRTRQARHAASRPSGLPGVARAALSARRHTHPRDRCPECGVAPGQLHMTECPAAAVREQEA